MESKLYNEFKESFISKLAWIGVAILIVNVLFASVIAEYFWDVTIIAMADTINLMIVFFSAIIEFITVAISAICLYPYFLDYKMVKKKQFNVIEGIIVDVKFVTDGTETPSTDEFPVVQDDKTDIKITLKLKNEFEYGEHYRIYYLPNTKLGIIVEKLYS